MYPVKVVIAVILAVLIQVVVSHWTGKRFNYVDLPLIVTVYFSLRRSQLLGMVVGMTSGWARDAITHSIVGVSGLTQTVVGYLVATVSLRVELDSFLLRLLTLGVASVGNTFFFIWANKILSVPQFMEMSNQEIWRIIGIQVGVNLAAGLFIFLLLDKLLGRPDPGVVEMGRARYYR